MKWVAIVLVTLVGLVAVASVTFLMGMRMKARPVLSAVRRMNRRFTNPRQMRTAGTPGAYAAVIRHTGRKSGRPYETPVGAEPTDDGFVIVLPYGVHTDWVANVLAAGSATLVREGETYVVDQPRVEQLDAVTEAFFAAKERRAQHLFGVHDCLRLRRVDRAAA